MTALPSRLRLFAIAAIGAALAATAAWALEAAPTASAASLLGADVKGANWTVDPVVKSDGFVRIFGVTTAYGKFQVNGQRRMVQRLQELRALHALEAMSTTNEFAKALANAGMAPIRFGRDLIVDPVETTGNVVSGIGKMFSNVTASVAGRSGSRDSALASITGQSAAERELAFRLNVDPYTDFIPLRKALADVGRAMTAGGLTVTAAIAVIPGGAGVAVSATATSADFANSIDAKTSADIAREVRAKLTALGVDEATCTAFINNKMYSPADLFAIADALTKLGAQDSKVFVASAAKAASADVAKFMRYRAELLLGENAHLGTIKSFVMVGDMALTMNAKGHLVAAFPFDLVAWTDTVQKSMVPLSAAAKATHPSAMVFVSTGEISPMAEAELKKLGWQVQRLG